MEEPATIPFWIVWWAFNRRDGRVAASLVGARRDKHGRHQGSIGNEAIGAAIDGALTAGIVRACNLGLGAMVLCQSQHGFGFVHDIRETEFITKPQCLQHEILPEIEGRQAG